MASKETLKIDPRWQVMQGQFNTAPDYVFATLEFPTSQAHARRIAHKVQSEIDSILKQYEEKELEELDENEYREWKLKATKAERMRRIQLEVIQCCLEEGSPSIEERLEQLERRITQLENNQQK